MYIYCIYAFLLFLSSMMREFDHTCFRIRCRSGVKAHLTILPFSLSRRMNQRTSMEEGRKRLLVRGAAGLSLTPPGPSSVHLPRRLVTNMEAVVANTGAAEGNTEVDQVSKSFFIKQ